MGGGIFWVIGEAKRSLLKISAVLKRKYAKM
jgi:hypothetical protein